MNQKTTLIVIIIVLVVSGLGYWLFSMNSGSPAPDVNTVKRTVKPAPAIAPSANQPAQVQTPPPTPAVISRKTDLEALIKKAIAEKEARIAQTSAGRALTADEKNFMANPRTNVIDELLASGKISSEDAAILNK